MTEKQEDNFWSNEWKLKMRQRTNEWKTRCKYSCKWMNKWIDEWTRPSPSQVIEWKEDEGGKSEQQWNQLMKCLGRDSKVSNGFWTRFAILIFSPENLLRHVFWFFIRNLVFVILDVYSINNLLRLFDKRSRRFHSSQVTKEMRIFHNRTAHLPPSLIKASWFELLKDMSLV